LRKVVFILSVILCCESCFVKREKTYSSGTFTGGTGKKAVFNEIVKQNISKDNFYIKKADIEISGYEQKRNLIGSIKFEKPDKYLISIKSRTGVEALRIFISGDTILANDRINRILYCGSGKYLYSKLGLKNNFIPVCLGDYISENQNMPVVSNCLDGYYINNETAGNLSIKYKADCKLGKVIEAISDKSGLSQEVEFHYSNFKGSGGLLTPRNIEIKDKEESVIIIIRIRQVEFQWSGIIEFFPGNRYELRRLL
jgi:hypothetical protein